MIRFHNYMLLGLIFTFLMVSCRDSSTSISSNKSGTVTDIDNNTYKTIIIGSQVWMAENLRTSRFQDGTIIPNATNNIQWGGLSTEAWAYYNNDELYGDVYGKLYNWYAVQNNKGVCPSGWRVPNDSEWTKLLNYLGDNAGGKLKDVESNLWDSPNTGATNESGFSALPGGARGLSGNFNRIGISGSWWSSNEATSENAWRYNLMYDSDLANRHSTIKKAGNSIRCIRN